MLACARIGAIHSVVFGGFSPQSLRDRILDSDCRVVITADEGVRGKHIPAEGQHRRRRSRTAPTSTVLTVRRTGDEVPWSNGATSGGTKRPPRSADCPCEEMDAEDPLFILYTSGSTGKPKGVQHTTGGYLLMATMTHRYVFDYQDGDIYWCTADVGWITGHSYIVYGPLSNGATTLMFEGVPTYPDASRAWQVCDKHEGPSSTPPPPMIRQVMAQGDAFVTSHKRKSLRLLGSVGEPINPEAWEWYYRVVGEALSDRRHLVADGNRRDHDHPASRARGPQTGQRGAALLRRAAGADGRRRQLVEEEGEIRGNLVIARPGRARSGPFTAITSA